MRHRRRLTLGLLWVFNLGYLAWIIPHAYGELNEDYVVEGLQRRYRLPYEINEGVVFDPKPRPLHAEIRARYRPEGPTPPPPPSDEIEAWRAYLAALSIPTRDGEGMGDGRQPRLIFTAAGPRLLVGLFSFNPVLFNPEHGAILTLPRALEGRPALILDAREAPW